MASVYPINLDVFDGGPPVDRKGSSGSAMSDDRDEYAKDYYDGDDFDEMIANVIEPSKRRGQQQQQQQQNYEEEYEDNYEDESEDEGPMVDMTPDDAKSNSASEDEADMNSLNSDDISGGSDISDVEEQRKKNAKREKFIAPPLINDDESTVDMRPPAPVNQSVSSYVEALNQQQTRKNRIVKLGMVVVLLGVIIGVVMAIVSVSGGQSGSIDGATERVDGVNGGGGGGNGLESNQINVKEGFVGNATSYIPSLSPFGFDYSQGGTVNFESQEPTMSPVGIVTPSVSPTLPPQSALPTSSPTLPPQSALPTSSPTLPPQSALPTKRPTPFPTELVIDFETEDTPEIEFIETEEPVDSPTDPPVTFSTDPPVISFPTPEPTPSPVTDEPTYEPTPNPTPNPTPGPTPQPTFFTTPQPTPNPTPWPTPKPFVITRPPTPPPTPKPLTPYIPPSVPTLHAGGGSPTDETFHCAEVRYTSNWNELVDFDCTAACSGLGMNTECPVGHQCRSDEGKCI